MLTDFLLTVIRNLLPKRPQLRVILMSVTTNVTILSQYFNNCPVLVIPGTTHEVTTYYLEDMLPHLKFRASSKQMRRNEKRDQEYKKDMQQGLKLMEDSKKFHFLVLKTLRMPESEESPDELVLELLKRISSQGRAGAILIFYSGIYKKLFLKKFVF